MRGVHNSDGVEERFHSIQRIAILEIDQHHDLIDVTAVKSSILTLSNPLVQTRSFI